MRKSISAFAVACLVLLAMAASAVAMSVSKASDYTLAWASNNCVQHARCLGQGVWGCEWLYSGHARCRAYWDYIDSSNNQIHCATNKYVYWVDDGNGGAERYNLPTAVYCGQLS